MSREGEREHPEREREHLEGERERHKQCPLPNKDIYYNLYLVFILLFLRFIKRLTGSDSAAAIYIYKLYL